MIVSEAIGQNRRPRTPQPNKSAHVHVEVVFAPPQFAWPGRLKDHSPVYIKSCNFYRSGLVVALTQIVQLVCIRNTINWIKWHVPFMWLLVCTSPCSTLQIAFSIMWVWTQAAQVGRVWCSSWLDFTNRYVRLLINSFKGLTRHNIKLYVYTLLKLLRPGLSQPQALVNSPTSHVDLFSCALIWSLRVLTSSSFCFAHTCLKIDIYWTNIKFQRVTIQLENLVKHTVCKADYTIHLWDT
jgi:hypothetical protein